MNSRHKILTYREAVEMAQRNHKQGVSVALATGTFDVVHAGHLDLLERADDLGSLFVGINDDPAVMQLKGPTRPINPLELRLRLIAGFQCVHVVFPIHAVTVAHALNDIMPTFWVKGADYSMDSLNQDEVQTARRNSVEIVLMPLVKGCSTTAILSKA